MLMMFDAMDGVIFDLDGTLVHLDVDWDGLASDLRSELDQLGVAVEDADTWECLAVARDTGVLDHIHSIVCERECTGAQQSRALPLAAYLDTIDVPIGVCSLNCERACMTALERHDLDEYVDVVIGRDSVDAWKPDPTPLAAAIDEIGVSREAAVFVGDSERDAITARRLSVPFRHVDALLATIDT